MNAAHEKHVYKVRPYRGPWKALSTPGNVLYVMEYFPRAFLGQASPKARASPQTAP